MKHNFDTYRLYSDEKIFVSYMQLIKENKYVEALGKVMDELKIPYKIEGPYKKNLAKHKL